MNLVEQLDADLKTALKARDKIRLSVIRLLKAALTNRQIEVGHDLSMPEVLSVLQKEAKKHRDSIEAYEKANRSDLVEQERSELKVIDNYLPADLSDSELTKIIAEVIGETQASGPAAFGQVMPAVMAKVAGRADGRRVSEIVKSQLS